MNRKLGKFLISNELLNNDFRTMEGIFRILHPVIVRAEQRYDMNGIEYIAIHDSFKEVSIGSEVPEYNITINKDEYGIKSIEFKELI